MAWRAKAGGGWEAAVGKTILYVIEPDGRFVRRHGSNPVIMHTTRGIATVETYRGDQHNMRHIELSNGKTWWEPA